ncbi:putative efflux protein, MATE family [Clostridium sp. DSM 8431]|uniref:MATE family efflux transporter n=1 Tax=Clostridium sp. DSM 8431 TaxID=1761781 RepID=UPI0008F14C5E|nr:MATE family efflux transporter [Clostridium sp. DSM 8431]SFU89093.1 putative efflux protein, MATE family [Clostridium sp. DSM 8431]
MNIRNYVGDKKFYKMVLGVAVPIMIQNGITNFVSLLDNIMVGQIGTEQMSGVAIVNQLIFVFNLCIFGVVSGVGIFGTQFWGKKDYEGVRETFRFKIISCTLIGIGAILLLKRFDSDLVSLFLHDGGNSGNIAETLIHGKGYLSIIVIGLIPFVINQVYSSTLRETGETVLQMKAGIVAVCVNMMFNYVLIFGKLGLPVLGARGAAIATVISRFVECIIIVVYTHKHKKKYIFIEKIYSSMKVSRVLMKNIFLKGTPLMCNELLWGAGISIMTQCYSLRGLAVVAAINIASTISNLFSVVYISLGSAVSIIIGQLLGAGKMEEARDMDRKLIAFSVVSCSIVAIFMIVLAPAFPAIYNTTNEVKSLASKFIIALAFSMPLVAFTNASYFTLRSGGKTVVTFLFDSVFIWVCSIPVAFILSRYTLINIVMVYFICQMLEFIKCIIGFVLVRSGVWIQNIVMEK